MEILIDILKCGGAIIIFLIIYFIVFLNSIDQGEL